MTKNFNIPCSKEINGGKILFEMMKDVPYLRVNEFSTITVSGGSWSYSHCYGKNWEHQLNEVLANTAPDAVIFLQIEAVYDTAHVMLTGPAGYNLLTMVGPEAAVDRFGRWFDMESRWRLDQILKAGQE